MQYRRITAPGGTFFFTLVTYERRSIFSDDGAVEQLRQAFRYVLLKHPFTIQAAVVLPDHLHMLWRLPPGDSDYSLRWRLIKSHFAHRWEEGKDTPTTGSRRLKGERAVWQRRFWEHLIRDDRDLQRHVDYIHYNPVKHGLVRAPVEWKYSSFHDYVKQGLYPRDWGQGEALVIELGEDIE
jgi:putative transposase